MKRTSVLIIYTGGTIGMIQNHETGALESFNFEHLLSHVPEIRQFNLAIEAIAFETPIDSSDMTPTEWQKLVRIISENYSKYDGFVILHGTDTMAFTSSALSFMLEGLNKPVILTGSQLPIGALRTDGKSNLITAIEIAAAKRPDGSPMVSEVCVVFHDKLFRGNRVTKIDSDNFSAFDSPNYPPLATLGTEIKYNPASIGEYRKDAVLTPHEEMDTRIIIFSLFPGLRPEIVDNVLSSPDLKGILFRTFGSGNAPKNMRLIETLKSAMADGKVIVNISQCMSGYVHQERYGAGLQLADSGIVSGRDMTLEAALTKLMFLFGRGLTSERVLELMDVSLAGEVTI
ncbi:MAG: asparaginase [Bacteroidales bacterium]|nr:asparaginase [Bacteroidales bacterium]MDY4175377.1 asparaginase [Bacteroidales bacterium]